MRIKRRGQLDPNCMKRNSKKFERLGVLPNSGHATPHLSNTLIFALEERLWSIALDDASCREFSILFTTNAELKKHVSYCFNHTCLH